MAVSTTTIAYALKRVYTQREIENAVYKDNPLFALMRKEGGFTGSHHVHALRYRDTGGRNATFSTAQTLAGTSFGATAGLQFLLTRVKNYQVYTLETEAILAGRDDKGSLIRTLTTEVDSALNNLGRDMAIDLYRAGHGAKAQLTSIAGSGDPYTWTVGEAITNFEVGQTVVVSNGSTVTAALRNSGTGVVITSVDRDAGTFTTATNGDTATANDWIFIKGDRIAGAITQATYEKLAGLDAWVPATAPSVSESFFGVDRSPDKTRNAGLRIDVSTYAPEEGLVIAMHKLAREGGSPSHLFMSFLDSRNVQVALGAKAETEYMQVGDIGFSSIRVRGPKGDVKIVPDQNAQAAVGNLLTLDTWAIKHLGDMINILDLDGARLSREAAADRFEGRMAFYGNVVCYAPGKNARLVLPS
jgi:hypothetical protein